MVHALGVGVLNALLAPKHNENMMPMLLVEFHVPDVSPGIVVVIRCQVFAEVIVNGVT